MACNALTQAQRLRKERDREVAKIMKMNPDDDDARDMWRAQIRQQQLNVLEEDIGLAYDIMMMMRRVAIEKGFVPADDSNTSGYLITISPDTSRIDFPSFRKVVTKFLQRKCLLEYTYSFEQRGVTDDTIGEGFHVHIVAKSSMRSKTELLRATLSTFKHCAEKQCIDVKYCKNPKTVVQKYLIDYECKDEHKARLKPYDEVWREREGLAALYQSHPPKNEEEDECATLVEGENGVGPLIKSVSGPIEILETHSGQ